MDLFKSALPALIALAGVVLTAILGYRQWRKQQEGAQRGPFRSDQQAAYKKLWEMVEQVHVDLRAGMLNADDFRNKLKGLNAYLLLNGLYIAQPDAALVNRYLETVRKLGELISSKGGEPARRAWSATQEVPLEVVERAQAIQTAQGEAQQIRSRLIDRFRAVLER